ncbi:hypothetical protein Fmac_004911 [Flemingia macrophylla]|uniref:Uncharacterized protein n=1 Tax=Flemingia macrophylla TaxID=520843 RepID=A0ABD1N6B2_9FABA
MWPLSSQKKNTTVKMRHESDFAAAATTTTTVVVPTKSMVSTCHCCCLVTKLMRKLKRRGHAKSASRQGLFQCRYDPLSYSLNFDSTGCGTIVDEDYYKFYAFSSRFVANPRTPCTLVQLPPPNH